MPGSQTGSGGTGISQDNISDGNLPDRQEGGESSSGSQAGTAATAGGESSSFNPNPSSIRYNSLPSKHERLAIALAHAIEDVRILKN